MILTEEIVMQGLSSNNGWNEEQLKCFGETFLKGWKKRIIGKDYSKETIQKFLDLKNTHLRNFKGNNSIELF